MFWRVAALWLCLCGLGFSQPIPFPANYRQAQAADELGRGPLEDPDGVALRRLLQKRQTGRTGIPLPGEDPGPKAWKQPEPRPNFLERLFDFSPLQGALSAEERLAMGLSLSAFFEYRRPLHDSASEGMADLRPASNAMFTFGEFTSAVGISAVPWLFGDGEVALASLEAITLAGVRTRIVKTLSGIERPRTTPPHVGPIVDDFYDNFPSGHSATVWAWATVLGEYYDLQWLTYPVASFMAVAVIARSNTHDFAEALAGSMLGHQTGLEVMRERGWLEPRSFASGPLEVQTDIGLEQLSDSNPALSPAGSASTSVGRFSARTRASYLIHDRVLFSARYDTVRRVYDSLPGNNQDHNRIELRIDGALNDNMVLGIAGYRDRVNFPELGPYSKIPGLNVVPLAVSGTFLDDHGIPVPSASFSTDPLFGNTPLYDVRQNGVNAHLIVMPAEGWNVTARLGYQSQTFAPNPGLSGDGVTWGLSGGTLLNDVNQGFQVHLEGGRIAAGLPEFDRDFLQGGVMGRLGVTHRDRIELSATLGRESYPGRGAWEEDYASITAQYSHRFGEDIWAWVGYTYQDRSAPAAGYTRSQPFLRLNGSF